MDRSFKRNLRRLYIYIQLHSCTIRSTIYRQREGLSRKFRENAMFSYILYIQYLYLRTTGHSYLLDEGLFSIDFVFTEFRQNDSIIYYIIYVHQGDEDTHTHIHIRIYCITRIIGYVAKNSNNNIIIRTFACKYKIFPLQSALTYNNNNNITLIVTYNTLYTRGLQRFFAECQI